MRARMKVFLTYDDSDEQLCFELITALRATGADVWYRRYTDDLDELNFAIERELRDRRVSIVLISPAALASERIEAEARVAYDLYRQDESRIFLPVLAQAIILDKLWPFLREFKLVETPDKRPYPPDVMASCLLSMCSLRMPGQLATPSLAQTEEPAEYMVTRGKALRIQGKSQKALELFQRVTALTPELFSAWFNLAHIFAELRRSEEALQAYTQALWLNNQNVCALNNKGRTLHELKRDAEALAALEQALAIDPAYGAAWNEKGAILNSLQRYGSALVALERSLALDPTYAMAWNNKGNALNGLALHVQALLAYERSLALDPTYAMAWRNKAHTLNGLGSHHDALAASERATALAPTNIVGWQRKAAALRGLKREVEARLVERRVIGLVG
jgi:tetratricopeptide (TPR) repeat protein